MTERIQKIEDLEIKLKSIIDDILPKFRDALNDYLLTKTDVELHHDTHKSTFIAKQLSTILMRFCESVDLHDTRYFSYSICMIWYFIEQNLKHTCENVDDYYIGRIRKELKDKLQYFFETLKPIKQTNFPTKKRKPNLQGLHIVIDEAKE